MIREVKFQRARDCMNGSGVRKITSISRVLGDIFHNPEVQNRQDEKPGPHDHSDDFINKYIEVCRSVDPNEFEAPFDNQHKNGNTEKGSVFSTGCQNAKRVN